MVLVLLDSLYFHKTISVDLYYINLLKWELISSRQRFKTGAHQLSPLDRRGLRLLH